ncbi:MAG: elongation factor P [Chlamydiia bacterium]|nr:elongation factor P [Chlamydiia bacterium]
MAQLGTNDIKSGMKVEIDGQPYTVVSNDFYKPGKGRATNRIRIRHLVNGRTIEKVYTSGDKIDLADVEETQLRLLYKEDDGCVFMNDTTFDQIKMMNDQIGDCAQWLLEDLVYDVAFYNGQPVTVQPPTFLEMVVTETAPGDRGNTASGRVLKPATLQSGAQVQIPIFVSEGEKIKVDTRTGEYVSRVSD